MFCSFQWFVAQFGAIPQVSRSLKSTGSCANLDAGWVAQCPQPTHGEFRCWKCRRIVECELNLEIDRANQCQTWLSWQIMTAWPFDVPKIGQSDGNRKPVVIPGHPRSISLRWRRRREAVLPQVRLPTLRVQGGWRQHRHRGLAGLVVSRNACDGPEEFEAYIPVDGDGEGAGGLVAGGWGSVSDVKGETSYHE